MRASQLYAPPMAMVTTAGLLLLMLSLINTDFDMPVVVDPPTIEPVVMNEPKLETLYPEPPVRPESPTRAPDPVADPVPNTQVASATEVNIGLPTMDSSVSTLDGYSGGELMPIVKVAPQYPRIALTRGIEAFVTVEFTVTETGRTRNVVIVDAATKGGKATSMFDRAAIAAAEQFKYQPRVQDGTAVPVHGVQNRFVFELD